MRKNWPGKICKNSRKTSIVELYFSKIVHHKSEAVINITWNFTIFFSELFKNNTYKKLILELVSEISLSMTKPWLKSVSFSLSESTFHNSIFIFATAILSRFGLSLSITAVFLSLDSFMCNGSATFAH